MKKSRIVGFAAALAFAGAASAQISSIGPFTGAVQEGFQVIGQWPPNGPCTFCASIPGAFGGICTLDSPTGGTNIHVTGGWGFVCTIGAHATPRISASTGGGGYDYNFSAGNEAKRFGGYFGTNCGVGGGMVEFYDANLSLIGSAAINHPADCSWNWYGWESTVPIRRVRVIGNFGGGGYVQMDDMEYDPFGSSCYPDCDGNGTLTIADFGCFQTKFVQNDPYADCDGNGSLTIADFGCFQTKFVQGCP